MSRLEPVGLVGVSQKRPADLLVVVPTRACPGATQPIALDVGITDASAEDAVEHGSWRVPTGALKSATRYEKKKRVRHAAVIHLLT